MYWERKAFATRKGIPAAMESKGKVLEAEGQVISVTNALVISEGTLKNQAGRSNFELNLDFFLSITIIMCKTFCRFYSLQPANIKLYNTIS